MPKYKQMGLFSETAKATFGCLAFIKNRHNTLLIEGSNTNQRKFASSPYLLFRGITNIERNSIIHNHVLGWPLKNTRSSAAQITDWARYVHKNHSKAVVSFTRDLEQAVDYAIINNLPDITAVIQVHPALVTMDIQMLASIFPEHFNGYDQEYKIHINDQEDTMAITTLSSDTREHAKSQKEIVSFRTVHGVDVRQDCDAIINYSNFISPGKLLGAYLQPTSLAKSCPSVFLNPNNQGLPISFNVISINQHAYDIINRRMTEKGIYQDHRPLHINDLSKDIIDRAKELPTRSYDNNMVLEIIKSVPREYGLGSSCVQDYLRKCIDVTYEKSVQTDNVTSCHKS